MGLPDVNLVQDTWVEIFSATGIASGSNILVANKTDTPILLQTNTAATPPASTNNDGLALGPYQSVKITAESYVYAKTTLFAARLHVEAA